MIINFKFSEGDYVTVIANPDLGRFEVNGLHCENGAISYTINNGEVEHIKYEYQLKLERRNKVVFNKIGFKARKEGKGKPIIDNIGYTGCIEVEDN